MIKYFNMNYWSVSNFSKWSIESLTKYLTINYPGFGCNNLTNFLITKY